MNSVQPHAPVSDLWAVSAWSFGAAWWHAALRLFVPEVISHRGVCVSRLAAPRGHGRAQSSLSAFALRRGEAVPHPPRPGLRAFASTGSAEVHVGGCKTRSTEVLPLRAPKVSRSQRRSDGLRFGLRARLWPNSSVERTNNGGPNLRACLLTAAVVCLSPLRWASAANT